MLNDQNILTLAKPFLPAEHGIKNNNPYLRKSAIRARLSKVDLLWSLGAPEYIGTEGDVVLYRGALTVGGVTRWGVGTGLIQRTENKQPVEGFALAKNIANAHKSAVSDILARAATEFGVGNYLRDKAWGSTPFNDWIAKVNGDKPQPAQTESPAPYGQPPQPAQQADPKPTVTAWANREQIDSLVKNAFASLGIISSDVCGLAGIPLLSDYAAWNTKYPTRKAAADAIKAAHEKPATPKQAVTIT